MADEKQKKNFQTEFSFSFGNIADKVNDVIGNFGEEPETAFFEEPLGGAKSADVKVKGGLGKLHIHPGDDVLLLAKVETRHVGKMLFSAEDNTTTANKTVKIENQVMSGGFRGIIGSFKNRDLYIDVALSPNLPLKLHVEGAVGEALLDLNGLNISELKLEGGVGPLTVYAPDGDYKANFHGGVGPTHINLPASINSKVKIEAGVGPVVVTVAENADLTLDAEGGVGPITFNIPVGTPLMLEHESGLGPFHRPSGLVQKTKNVWHTEGYDLAERSVYIKIEGGIGPSRVNFVTPDGEKVKGKRE